MMIEAVMYGFKPSAKIDRRRSAPPPNTSRSWKNGMSATDFVNSALEIPGMGTGTLMPSANTLNIMRTNSNLRRSSSSAQA